MSEAAAGGGKRSGPGVASLFSDRHLVRQAIDGDQRAFTAIFRRYHQSLYRFCLTIVGEPQDAQDALQNTMVKVLRALPGEKRQIELKPWLYRIAHNESIELLRRRRGTTELDPELAAPGSGLAEEAEVRERLRRLIFDLDELPDRQRSALVMRELAGLEFAEIGAALGTSSAVARQTVYEARLGLSQMEAGREMNCATVTKALSDADGRVIRRRDMRAHLRGCSSCRRFREELDGRQADLAALAPLPAVAATGLLHGILGSHGGSTGAGLAGTLSASGKAVGASVAVKAAATVAVVAVAGVSANQSGLVDVGLPGKGASPPAATGAGHSAAPGARALPSAAHGARVDKERTEAQANGTSRIAAPEAGAAAAGDAALTGQPGNSNADAKSTPSSRGASTEHPRGRGHEKQLPVAAAHGQETAATHKSAGKGGSPADHTPSSPPAKPPQPTHPSKPDVERAGTPPEPQAPEPEMPPQAAAPPPIADSEASPTPPRHDVGEP